MERFDCSHLDRLLLERISSVIFEFEVLHGPTRLCYKYCQGKYKDLIFLSCMNSGPFSHVAILRHFTFACYVRVNKEGK